MIRHLLPATILLAIVCFSPSKTSAESVEEWLGGPWKIMRIGFSWDDGCTGKSIRNEFTITRKGTKTFLHYPEQAMGSKSLSPYSRPLQFEEFDQIQKTMLAHLRIAESEIDRNEYFNAFPEEERMAKLEEYFKTNPRPFGGFGGNYLHIKFGEGKSSRVFYNAFETSEAGNKYYEWVCAMADRKWHARKFTPRRWHHGDWQELEKSIAVKHPETELIFTRFDPDRDYAIKVFLDRKNDRALVISWSKDPEVIYEKVGQADVHRKSKFTSLEKGEWIHKPAEGSVSLNVVSILSEIRIVWEAGESKPAVAFVLASD